MAEIKAVVLDVDGVLTDGTFWWGTHGEEFKRFSFVDIMGISRARKAGLLFALISGEVSPLIERFAAKLGISDVYTGCKDKAAALTEFTRKHSLELPAVCYMGDDINDLPALKLAGLSAAPASAHVSVRRSVRLVMQSSGGQGAVRELLDTLLSSENETGNEALSSTLGR